MPTITGIFHMQQGFLINKLSTLLGSMNIQQLINVQRTWWCIDNFTIINQNVLCLPPVWFVSRTLLFQTQFGIDQILTHDIKIVA